MNLQEATTWIKDNLNQEIGANTLRKACASGRLRGVRKGEGSMHIRRTEWEVTKEGLKSFIQEEYHPRPSRRGKKIKEIHIPNNSYLENSNKIPNQKNKVEELEATFAIEDRSAKIFYRVVEHLFQNSLPIHGSQLERYDTRIVEDKIYNRSIAEELVERLQGEAGERKLSHQLRYEIQSYVSSKKAKL